MICPPCRSARHANCTDTEHPAQLYRSCYCQHRAPGPAPSRRALRRTSPAVARVRHRRRRPATLTGSVWITTDWTITFQATGRTWITWWRPEQAEEQARYLVGVLRSARLAGYIRLPDPDDPYAGL